MKINRIKIENFKSIEKVEFTLDKIGDSYTKFLVGVNESGKSNILKALSYFKTPTEELEFLNLCNQKNENAEYVDLFFDLEFENSNHYKNRLKNEYEYENDLEFEINNITKNVYLSKDSKKFEFQYDFQISLLGKTLFFKEMSKKINENKSKQFIKIVEDEDNTEGFEVLTEKIFKELFNEKIIELIIDFEPEVTFWTPSDEYLLTDVNLKSIIDNKEINKPLKNIFTLAGFDSIDKVNKSIENIGNSQRRSQLNSKLQQSLNNYLKKVWKHNIEVIIDITETGLFSLSIRDKGSYNEHDRFSINERSEGAKHFLSLILSLSLESNNKTRNNELILIDEPEQHLHPSGIRDLSKELLNIGNNNYVFIATHSPFLIDKKHKTRHFIITKNNKAITESVRISKHQNLIDDEVLRVAFGIEVYKDLLNPHSLLVEGCSDKVILQKTFNLLEKSNIGISNGHGSNVDTLASKLNHDDLSIMVILDADTDGKKYKEKILEIGGVYSSDNVYTLRDIVGELIDGATIEDLLDQNFIKTQFTLLYNKTYNDDVELEIDSGKPIIGQLIVHLKKKKKYSTWDMDLFKKCISDNFNPTKISLDRDFPLLKSLAEKIIEKLEK